MVRTQPADRSNRRFSRMLPSLALALLLVACGSQATNTPAESNTDVSLPTEEGAAPAAPTEQMSSAEHESTDTGADTGSEDGYSAGKLISAQSWHFVITREVESNGQVTKESAEGDFDRDRNALHYTFRSPNKGSSSEYDPNGEWVHVDGQSYQKRGGKWEKSNFQWVTEDMQLPNTFSPVQKETEPDLVGTETIDGQQVNHYRYKGEFKGFAGSTYDAYISKETGDLYRVDSTTPDGKLKYSTVFTKWDEPVTLPDPTG